MVEWAHLEWEAGWSTTPFTNEFQHILQLTTVCCLKQQHHHSIYNIRLLEMLNVGMDLQQLGLLVCYHMDKVNNATICEI